MAEKRVIELEISTNEKSFKAQLREAQAEVVALSEKFGATSDQAVKAAKKAAELKDAIGDAKSLTDAFNPDAKFNALSSSIGGVLNGFQAFEGALGLVGVEGEALQETMLKVQSAMAVSQGIQGLMEAKDSFKQLGAVAMNALKGIKTGIAATGIGLLVVALGTLVAYWDDIKTAVNGVSSEQEQLNIDTEKNVAIENEKLNSLNSQDNILKLQGKSEREILQIKIKQIDATIAATEEQIKQNQITAKAQEESALRNFKIAKQIIAAITKVALIPVTAMVAQIDLLVKGANYVSQTLGGGKLIDLEPLKEANKYFDKLAEKGAKMLFDPDEVKAQGKKLKAETEKQLQELKNTKAGYQIAIKEIDARGKDEALSKEKEYNDKLRAYYDAIEAERQAKITSDKEKELQELDNKYEELYAKADASNQDTKALIEEHQKEINAITEKYAKLDAEAMLKAQEEANKLRLHQEQELQNQIEQIDEQNFQTRLKNSMTDQEYELELTRQKYFELEEAAKGNAEQLAIIEEAKGNEIDAINEKYAEQEKARKKATRDFALEMTQSGLQTVVGLTELFQKKGIMSAKKAFQVQKAAQIASATIDTYKSATGAYASQMTIPSPDAPVRAAIAASVAVAAGLVNVAKIASQKFEGGGSSGGSAPSAGAGGGGSGVAAPNFNVVGSSGVNQLAQIQQQPTRAYVVSGDIQSGLSLERNRLQNATL